VARLRGRHGDGGRGCCRGLGGRGDVLPDFGLGGRRGPGRLVALLPLRLRLLLLRRLLLALPVLLLLALLAVAALLLLLAVVLLALAAAAATVAALAALAAVIAALRALVALAGAAALRLAPRLRLPGHGRLAGPEETEDPVPQAGAALLRLHRLDRRGRGLLARLAHGRRLRRAHVGHRSRRRHVEVGLGQGDGRELARGAALVARAAALLAELVLADARDLVMRGLQLRIGDDHDRGAVAPLDAGERAALLVEQVVGDLHRRLHQHLAGVVLHRVLLGDADDGQRQRLDAAHAAVALAARADDLARLAQARAQALARHLQQAEARDAAELHARAIRTQRLLQPVLDLALVLVGGHVDEVDHHQAAEVAQAHLARDFLGRLQVGVERGFLDVAALGGARRVDVHRGQGLGLVDHQRAAGGQAHLALVGVLDLRLDLEPVEQRDV